jgi:hypothetical protein
MENESTVIPEEVEEVKDAELTPEAGEDETESEEILEGITEDSDEEPQTGDSE